MIRKGCVVALCVLLTAVGAWAVEISGILMPDSLALDGHTLVLNGAGLRKKMFISVYAGGLYLTDRETDPIKIQEADEPMAIRMHFLHDRVSKDSLVNAWKEGFEHAAPDPSPSLKERMDRFNACFREDARKGDVYEIRYLPGRGAGLSLNQTEVETLPGLDFKKAVFGIWLGEKPADAKLKKGMLGR